MALFFKKQARNSLGGRLSVRRSRGPGWSLLGNFFLLLVLWLSGVIFINMGGPQRYVGLAEGQRAPATVVAAVDFDCVNMAATELLRRQAGERAVPVFTIQTALLNAAWRVQEKLADRALSLRRGSVAPAAGIVDVGSTNRAVSEKALESDLTVAADLLGVSVPGEALAKLFPPGREMDVLADLKESLSEVWMSGILTEAERESGFQGLSQSLTIDIVAMPEDGDAPIYRTTHLSALPSVEMALESFVKKAHQRLVA